MDVEKQRVLRVSRLIRGRNVRGVRSICDVCRFFPLVHDRGGANLQHPCRIPEATASQRHGADVGFHRRQAAFRGRVAPKGRVGAVRVGAARALRAGLGRAALEDGSALTVGRQRTAMRPMPSSFRSRSQPGLLLAQSPLLKHYPKLTSNSLTRSGNPTLHVSRTPSFG